MDVTTPETCPEPKAKRVKFGPKPNQVIPHEWAEGALMWLFEHHQRITGEAFQYAMGFDPVNGRRRGSVS